METTTLLPENVFYGQLFSWLDYTLFGSMLALSTIIGIYFGFFGKKQNTANDYLMGGKRMHVFPIAVSLIASQISTTTLLAVPADVYKFGSNYIWLSVSTFVVFVTVYYVYLPVFFELQVTSIYEYLELRFDKKTKILGAVFTLISVLVYCPIVIYVPSLAFSQVTGVNVKLIASITSLICVFYTSVGGLKAVVWTDTLQLAIMVITFLVVFFIGLSSVGGFTVVMDRAISSGRFDVLDFSFDPTLRDSFGALLIGGTAQWISYTGVCQGLTQKCLSVPTFQSATRAFFMYTVSISAIHVFAVLVGLLMYAHYSNCDPLVSGQISRVEQLVPQFVMEVTGNLPGLPGVFIAGVFSAGLSSLSANLNSISGVVYKDFLTPFMPKSMSEKRVSKVLKMIVVALGIICTLIVLFLDKIKGIFPFYIALMAVSNGPILGIFTMGLLFPCINSKGAFYGAILSMLLIGWIAIQNQWYQFHGLHKEFLKPVSTEGCNFTFPLTVNEPSMEQPFYLYRISFWFYTLIGSILSMVFGFFISWVKSENQQSVPKELISPFLRNYWKTVLRLKMTTLLPISTWKIYH